MYNDAQIAESGMTRRALKMFYLLVSCLSHIEKAELEEIL